MCFVDFKKAFDSVWHNGLFRKLENKGINGNFLNLIKSIYAKTKCAIKINGKVTNSFNYLKGVQQGNPLSSTLFNLFLNDIFDEIKNASPVSLNNVMTLFRCTHVCRRFGTHLHFQRRPTKKFTCPTKLL